MSLSTAPETTHTTRWDRAVVIALGGAGCALSYDALQQMAVAIHVRGFLTYLFPLVIDGFIAYGVRALLVLRDAPLRARLYVWTLFGTATAASIWANALHAVRLNEESPRTDGLRLGDTVVAALSTIAPLALAGAVHLYILIARRATGAGMPGPPDTPGVRTERITDDRPDTDPVRGGRGRASVASRHRAALPGPDTGRPAGTRGPDTSETLAPDTLPGEQGKLDEPGPEHGDRETDQGGHLAPRPRPVTRPALAKRPDTTAGATVETGPAARPDSGARKPPPVTDEELLVIARQAVTGAGDLTRKVVADAIRGHGHGLGNDRLTVLMQHLRKEADKAPATQTS
ncbi:DUF2637 domain-containing protein [Actinacidiphila sp. bgisy167]|uniref:DUF2637 domain-containing protein n=1 Tax=Actinacidiphila sp. bgisy167 TaxID=3413797 RepID=UPI003D72F1E9